MAAATAPQADPTIFSRLERLDVMMGYLEEIIRVNGRARRSSCASTTSSGTPTGSEGAGGGGSSVGSSPKSLERRCRPLVEVMQEAQLKGSLVDRLHYLEERVLKLSVQLEEEMESERKKEEEEKTSPKAEKHHDDNDDHQHHHRKGLKSLVKACVRGKRKAPKGSSKD